jgi:DNA-binding MarR family transcriptional regulator
MTQLFDKDQSIGHMLGLTYRKLSTLFLSRMKSYEITPEQWSVLFQIHKAEGLIQKEIAERSGRDRPTTTRILDHLEQRRLVYRKIGERDRRSFKVYITDEGKRLMEEMIPVERRLNEEVRQCVSDEELDLLRELLSRIGQHVQDISERE